MDVVLLELVELDDELLELEDDELLEVEDDELLEVEDDELLELEDDELVELLLELEEELLELEDDELLELEELVVVDVSMGGGSVGERSLPSQAARSPSRARAPSGAPRLRERIVTAFALRIGGAPFDAALSRQHGAPIGGAGEGP